MTTKEPVTVSGWYENIDGTVQYYSWRDGQLVDGEKVASWADVPKRDYAAEDRTSRTSRAAMTHQDVLEWARTADAGDYLARYNLTVDSDDSSCGYSDVTLDEVGRELGKRGMTLEANDRGLVASR